MRLVHRAPVQHAGGADQPGVDEPGRGAEAVRGVRVGAHRDGGRFLTLYAGLGAGCLRQIFYATSRYGLFETFRDAAAKYRETDFAQRFTLASVAGGCAAFISCPVEVCPCGCRTRARAQPAAEQRGYKSVFDAFGRIMGEEGFGAFYRGSQPFVMRAMLVGGTQVATYDQFKTFYQKQMTCAAARRLRNPLTQRASSRAHADLLFGRADRRGDHDAVRDDEEPHEFQKPDAAGKLPYTSTPQTIATIARTEGTLALWNGFFPYRGRCGGHTVTMFFFVEEIRKIYRRYRG